MNAKQSQDDSQVWEMVGSVSGLIGRNEEGNQQLSAGRVQCKMPIWYPDDDAKQELDKRRQNSVEWSSLWKYILDIWVAFETLELDEITKEEGV